MTAPSLWITCGASVRNLHRNPASSESRLDTRHGCLSGRSPAVWPVRPSIPLACGRHVPEAGPICEVGILQPNIRSVTRHPAQRRPRPAGSGNSGSWGLGVSGSGDAGAGGHETGVGIAPQGDQQLAGYGHDHDPADPSPGTGGAGLEPLAQRTVGLEPHPSPRHLHELGSDPGGPVAADPLV